MNDLIKNISDLSNCLCSDLTLYNSNNSLIKTEERKQIIITLKKSLIEVLEKIDDK